jgi:hypothetical protein
MADGKEYPVPHRDYISLPPRAPYVIVYADDGHFTVLSLLTMTGLQSSVADASAEEKQVCREGGGGAAPRAVVYSAEQARRTVKGP